MVRADTRTGGREAAGGVIEGGGALAVGKPATATARGFSWVKLTDVARLESGHTPSRRQESYWNGGIPWVGIRDATSNHGRVITETAQNISQAGLENSSARLLPAGTVCLSRTASVGYVVVMGTPMATSQDFLNWVCGPAVSSSYLRYVLLAEQESVRRFSHGSTHQTVYYPEAKAFHVCLPGRGEQQAIADVLGALDDKIGLNERMAETSLAIGRSVFRQETQLAGVEATVGDFATFNYGKALPAPLRQPGSVPVFGCTGQVGFHDTALTQSAHPVVGRKGANAGHVSWMPEPGWIIDTAFYAVSKRKEVSNELLYFALDAAGISALIADSAVPGVNRDVALRHKFHMPEFGHMERLSVQAEALLAACQQAARENRTLADLRDTLLPQLITGKLRVKDATRVVEEAV
ncbi:restriction endonuclease subunit S [Streptomyces rubiginosohelvolus]|uniref:restriction endonuclease subunit S n=1 Tax=Streptomyces rubiginosohelvolus TaxID=67362 RepID=UPI0033D7881D